MVKLRAEGNTGRVAIWTGSDDAPFADPLNNLHRVKFHSELNYTQVLSQHGPFNVTFPARTWWGTGPNGWRADNDVGFANYPLFAHGRPGQPWVLGSANVGGVNVAFTGSIPVQKPINSIQQSGAPQGNLQNPWARWVTLGADSTNVYLFEAWNVGRDAPTSLSGIYWPAITIPVTVWVTDEILSA